MRYFILLLSIFSFVHNLSASGQSKRLFAVKKGIVNFHSIAPKELISAESKQLRGLVDFEKGKFFFKIKMNSFEGFNNELQREHFNENYIESSIYPEASFDGKIIESIDINKNQVLKIRSKGKLSLHGVSKECIINVNISIKNLKIEVNSDFEIELQDYNIKIPKVVYNKLASKIFVHVNAQIEAL